MSTAARTVAYCIGAAVVLASAAACDAAPQLDPAAVPATADGPGTQLAAWIARSIPVDAQLTAADPATSALVARTGVTATVAVPVPSAPGVDRYRISRGTPSTDLVRALSPSVTAVPVARFGDGASALLVDRLVAGPATEVASAVSQADVLRATADTALLTNPAVTVCGTCRSVLSHGGLDLRAASLIAVLATSGRVTLSAVQGDVAETRVGVPARTVVVGGASPGAVRAVAGATVTSYRPTIAAVTTATTTLTWTLTPTTTLTGV